MANEVLQELIALADYLEQLTLYGAIDFGGDGELEAINDRMLLNAAATIRKAESVTPE